MILRLLEIFIIIVNKISPIFMRDELCSEDGRTVYVEEVRVERLAESILVYNLEIEGWHTYYVGSGVLVHNACEVIGDGELTD